MAQTTWSPRAPVDPIGPEHEDGDVTFWRERSRIFLQPVAAPSILGLFALFGTLLAVGGWLAGWYGTGATVTEMAPLVAFFALAQLVAAVWSYRARDGMATALHGIWGAFWLGFAALYLIGAAGTFAVPARGAAFPGLAIWFVVVALVSGFVSLAAARDGLAVSAAVGLLTSAAVIAAVGLFGGFSAVIYAAGWVMVGAGVVALYDAAGLMLEQTYGRVVLPLGRLRKGRNIPGHVAMHPIEYEAGQPGVHLGQ